MRSRFRPLIVLVVMIAVPQAVPAYADPVPPPVAKAACDLGVHDTPTGELLTDESLACQSASFISVSAGLTHTCGLLDDATVRCWGGSEYGQLGDGTKSDRPKPVAVQNLNGVTAVSAGGNHTCALLDDGTVRCWGSNQEGQLGEGTSTQSSTPVAVPELSAVVAISSGGNHSCALTTGGTVQCWGSNREGQLGDGTTTNGSMPVAVQNLSGATAITAGGLHTCALLGDSTARCWGHNGYGQLGDGTGANRSTPVAVEDLSGATAISAGAYHTCALKDDGTARCWGNHEYGQLGDGTTNRNSSTPVVVRNLSGVTDISAGWFHTCAQLGGGAMRCWGWNGYGQLGDGTTTNRRAPVTVQTLPVALQNLSGVTAISAGAAHTCALLDDATLRCWGWNHYGQLGDGTTTNRSTPVEVQREQTEPVPATPRVEPCDVGTQETDAGEISTPGTLRCDSASSVSAGLVHTCQLLDDATVHCWGYNGYGQLGDGTTTHSSTPVKVQNLSGVTAISAGTHHTCALLDDATVRCWGQNLDGQLGDRTITHYISTPVPVQNLSDVTAIGAGGRHTCALLEAATMRCWGSNQSGQLGDGTTTDSLIPVGVQNPVAVQLGRWVNLRLPMDLSGVRRISAGGAHTCALLDDTTARCWGSNGRGQLGDGTTQDSPTPVAVLSLPVVKGWPVGVNLGGVAAVSAGAAGTCALLDDATLRCWGANRHGELGDGTTTDRSTPVTVQNLAGAAAISKGVDHTCALLDDGTMRCWGRNDYGQLGDGTDTDSSLPLAVQNVGAVSAISAGWLHTCALLDDATTRCWGSNMYGQLGDGATIDSSTPVSAQSS